MNQIRMFERTYTFKETFDVNIALHYETDRWGIWQLLREFVSNSLDAVGGDHTRVSITESGGYVHVSDSGNGYPIVLAKRIGASSKRQDEKSIGQFGEGSKLALLTCIRRQIDVMMASQQWLICPRITSDDADIKVLVFDIFETEQPITGSTVSLKATDEIKAVLADLGSLFLQFGGNNPLHGTTTAGIFASQGRARLYNKGVFTRDISALYSYGLSLDCINRDRDFVDESKLVSAVTELWSTVSSEELISTYFKESEQAGLMGVSSKLVEFQSVIYPKPQVARTWLNVFRTRHGEKAVVQTDPLASKEAALMGYTPVRLEYYGRILTELLGVKRDTDVCRGDYEFSWTQDMSSNEDERLVLFRKVANLIGLDAPSCVRLYDHYAKSDYVLGLFSPNTDEVYLKRDHFNGNLIEAFTTFLHELNHRQTRADDYDREFADGLCRLAGNLAFRLASEVGFPIQLKITERGVQLPRALRLSAETMSCRVATLGNTVLIQVAGCELQASVKAPVLKPYATERAVTYYKGYFYANMPGSIRDLLPTELTFYFRDGSFPNK